MNHAHNKYGFTLVELMLAMGFVSALLLAIAMTVIQIGNIYNRGITYKNVNQTGGALASELIRDINSSSSFDLSTNYKPTTWGGRLCIGQYSYIWNYGKALKPPLNTSRNMYTTSKPEINFVKVIDSNANYCVNSTTTGKSINPSGAVELLNVGQNDLAIHNFLISSDAYDSTTTQHIYSISFLIGTNDQETLNGSFDLTKCRLENDNSSNPSYCAVNQFDIVARAGNNVAD